MARGGGDLTRCALDAARARRRPRLHLDIERIASDPPAAAARLRRWIARHRVRVLNVAGARESQHPGIHAAVRRFLAAALRR